MRKMVKLTESTMEVERSKQKTTEIKSTYHIQLIPHLREVKGEKTHILNISILDSAATCLFRMYAF